MASDPNDKENEAKNATHVTRKSDCIKKLLKVKRK